MVLYKIFRKPLPPGTKIEPWVPQLIFTPVARAFERVGVYFYNRVLNRTEIGLRSKHYNPRVHGPYCHYRYYGKADTKLFDVKLSELPAWFSRRDKSIGGIYDEFIRNVYVIHHKWYGSLYGSPIRAIFRAMYAICFFVWLFRFYFTWDFRQAYYH